MKTGTAPTHLPYDGGVLTFGVPEGWVTEAEADGSTMFYEKGAEAGTLRVKVLTFTSEDRLNPDVALAELKKLTPEPGQRLWKLPSGYALRAHRERADDSGEPTVFFIWILASVDPPHRMRMAVFSFAVLADEADAPPTRSTVELLDQEIRNARFAGKPS